MAEIKHIRVDVQDPDSGYLELTSVVAEVVKIVQNDPNKGYALIGLRDFAGQEIVALIRGRVRPGRNEVGKVSTFMLSGQTKENKINYSGFYNPKDEIPAQYLGKRPPKPASEATGGGKSSGGNRDSNRGFALSYAKDLACAGAITMKQLPGTAIKFTTYLDTGKWPVAPPTHQLAPVNTVPEEDEIPETSDKPAGPYNQGEASTGGADVNQYAESAFGEGALDDVPF